MNNILYINTSSSENIFLSLFMNKKIFHYSLEICKGEMSTKLLESIEKFLKEHALDIYKINAICVYTGPGPYTSLRVGIANANTLAWVLNIPIFCIKGEQKIDKEFSKFLDKLKKQKKFIAPVNAYYQQAL